MMRAVTCPSVFAGPIILLLPKGLHYPWALYLYMRDPLFTPARNKKMHDLKLTSLDPRGPKF